MFGSALDTEHPFGRIRAMGRTRVCRRRLGLVLIGALVVAIWAGPGASALGTKRAVPTAGERYVVRAGDTLWSIAEHRSPGEDPRSLVDAIAEANGVDAGSLVPGQTLVVPTAG